jgi:ligand-binding sensor domain-containing protein/integrase
LKRTACRCFLLVMVVLCCALPNAVRGEPVPTWASFTREISDLPSDDIRALALGQDGSLWAGTYGGLARLDREGRWQSYTRANTNGGLPGDMIEALALGQDGSLWVGTRDAGLARLDREGRWQSYTRANTNGGLPGDAIGALALGQDGSLWVGTRVTYDESSRGGLARLDREGRWQSYTRANTNGGLPDDDIGALALGQDGSLWAETYGAGLARLDREGRWQSYTQKNTNGGLPSDYIDALALGQDGTLWVGTSLGLARLDREGRWQSYTQKNTNGGLPSDEIRALALGQDGSLWAGTIGGGLARLDREGRWQSYTRANTNGGLPGDDIGALALGQDGSLWAGTYGAGLARLDRKDRWQSYTRANTNGGLPSDTITALAPGQDGSLWVGTSLTPFETPSGGLARLDREGRRQSYTRANTNGGLPSDNYNINALALGQDGTLWVGTSGGLARLDREGRWQSYTRANTNGGLPSDDIRALALGQDGSLWVALARGGLARLDREDRWQRYTQRNTNGGLPSDDTSILALALGQDGTLWVATLGGLARLDREGRWQRYTQKNTNGGLPSDDIWALALGQDGSLWVGTRDAGLARLDHEGRWQSYTRANTNFGLPSDDIWALALGQDGSLWVGTRYAGLARLDREGHWQSYTRANTNGGLPGDDIGALALGQDGSLWAGTFGAGLARFSLPARAMVQIVDVLGETGDVSQADETVAVDAFDASYSTQPEMFHYAWSLSDAGSTPSLASEVTTRSNIHRVHFSREGTYWLSVAAIDRYGNRSEAKLIPYHFTLPKQPSLWDRIVSIWPMVVPFFLLTSLLLLLAAPYNRYCHLALMNPFLRRWASFGVVPMLLTMVPALRSHILKPYRSAVIEWTRLGASKYVIPTEQFAPITFEAEFDNEQGVQHVLTLYGESGIGKSAFLAFLAHECASRSHTGLRLSRLVPILVELNLEGSVDEPEAMVHRQLQERGDLYDNELVTFFLQQGGFLFIFDGLNEVAEELQRKIVTFAGLRGRHNYVCLATQVLNQDLKRVGKTLRLGGLDRDKVEKLVKKLAPDPGKFLEQFTDETYAMCKVPLQLELAIRAWQLSGTVPYDTDSLYSVTLGSVVDPHSWSGHEDYPTILCDLALLLLTEKRPYDATKDNLPQEMKATLVEDKIMVSRGNNIFGTYLATISATKSVASIRRRMVAIAQAHKDAGAPNPVAHRDVQKVLAGIVRTKTVAQTRKDALTKDRLEEAVKALGMALKGQRDRALLLLTFACALRRAEAAALDIEDPRYDSRGLVVTIRRSKTDQEGEGREIGVPFVANGRLCAATHVRTWLEAAAIVDGPVFRTFNGGKKLTAIFCRPDGASEQARRADKGSGASLRAPGKDRRRGFTGCRPWKILNRVRGSVAP